MTRAHAYEKPNNSADKVIAQYSTLVQRIAHHLVVRLPASIQVDDLIQAGMIGLIEAYQQYDATKGASFETYAGIRIRGAMLDDMRKGDWVPRSVHKANREISETIGALEKELGHEPSDKEIAEKMGLSLTQYIKTQNDINSSRLVGIDDLGITEDHFSSEALSHEDAPFQGVEQDSFAKQLSAAIKTLPEREALVLSLYYDEELNLKEIGAVIGVSESRVSQIQNQAMQRLKAKLSAWTT